MHEMNDTSSGDRDHAAVDGRRPSVPRLVIPDLDESDRPQIKEMVYQRLVRAVVDGELPPGTHLKERDLSISMGVSKTPIREALVRMEKERLVTTAPYRGAVVRAISRSDLREVYELRELLEGFCARRAAMTGAEQDEDEFRRNVHETRRALAEERAEDVAVLLEQFDHLLHRQARDHRIGALLVDLETQLHLFGRLTYRADGRMESSLTQHEEILRAITAHDPDHAEQACRRHVRSVYASLVDQFPVELRAG